MRRKEQRNALWLGIFTVVTLALVYVVFVVFLHLRGANGYSIGVRFANASGLTAGAPVYLNGVQIGVVDKVELLPDSSVEVILAITRDVDLPVASRIIIHSSPTGSPDVRFLPPRLRVSPGAIPTPLPPSAVIPKHVLPLNQQPLGKPPLSTQELMAQSQAVLHRSARIVSMMQGRRKVLLASLNEMRANSGAAMSEFRGLPQTLRANMGGTLQQAQADVSHAQALLRTQRNEQTMGDLSRSLTATSSSLQQTMNDLQGIRTDPSLRANMAATMQNVKQATASMHAASFDAQTIGSNPQTRAELLDASLRLRASLEKLRYLITHRGL